MKKSKRKPGTKAGGSKVSAAHKRKLFVEAYLSNGENATQAAVTAGFSAKTARSAGPRLLAHVEVATAIEARRKQTVARAIAHTDLTVERTLREVARIAYFDPRRFFDANGHRIPVHELDDDAAAVLASLEIEEMKEREDGVTKVVGHTVKMKVWDKNSALDKAMKHLGQYEKDNKQTVPVLPPVLRIIGVKGRK